MKNKILIPIVLVLVVAFLVFIGTMMVNDSKAAKFEITEDSLSIQCSFGTDVPLSEIENLTTTDTLPAVGTKTNGAGIGSMQKGQYNLKDGRKARLYLDKNQPLFITFTQDDTVFFLNADTQADTQALFDQLQKAVK